jgi:hypothetical protein
METEITRSSKTLASVQKTAPCLHQEDHKPNRNNVLNVRINSRLRAGEGNVVEGMSVRPFGPE